MSKAKEQYEELVREISFNLMVQRRLKDFDKGRIISNEEMWHRVQAR